MPRIIELIENHWAALTLCMLMGISALSLYPYDGMPSVSGPDKLHHLVAYTMLMIPVAVRKPKYWQMMGLGFVVFSGMIELIQPYVNRFGEWLDLLANSLGVICGLLLAEWMTRFFRYHQTVRLSKAELGASPSQNEESS